FADVDGFGLAFSHEGDESFSALVDGGDPEPELCRYARKAEAGRSKTSRNERRRMSRTVMNWPRDAPRLRRKRRDMIRRRPVKRALERLPYEARPSYKRV